MFLTLVLTHRCNLACSYCYMGDHHSREMPAAVADQALEFAFAQPGALDLAFFGGEPLLCYEHLLRIAQAARARAAREARSLRLSVTTNGTLLTPTRIRELIDLDVAITLSFDGVAEAQDATRPQPNGRSSFASTLAAAEALRDAGAALHVIAVMAPANVRFLGRSVRFLASVGVTNLTLNPAFEPAWSDEDLAAWHHGLREAGEVYEQALRAGRVIAMPTFDNKLLAAATGGLAPTDQCGAGHDELAVAPSGNLYPCARLVADDRDPRWVIGHAATGINVERLQQIRRGPAGDDCGSCAERWRCGASCVCANLAETGEPHVPGGVQCWYEQACAEIADDIGHRLLADASPTFLSWIYGRMANATPPPQEPPVGALPSSPQYVGKFHLPVVP